MYYNNTDKPESITDEEWDNRGKDWDKALGYNAPSDNGLMVEFINKNTLLNNLMFKDLSEDIKEIYEYRLEKVAKSYVHRLYYKRIKRILNDDSSTSDYIKEHRKLTESKNYQKDINKAKKKFEKILPLTYELRSYTNIDEIKPIYEDK